MTFTDPDQQITGYKVTAADWNELVTNEIDLDRRNTRALTQTQRLALTGTDRPTGCIVWDTTNTQYFVWDGTNWQALPRTGQAYSHGAAITAAGLTSTSGLTVSSGSTSLQAASATTLSTSGAATLASASVTGNETVGGTLGVTGATTLGALTATGTVDLPITPKYGRITRTANTGQDFVISGNAGVSANLNFGASVDAGAGISYSGGVFTFSKYGRWYLATTVAFSVIPANGAPFALRFKQGTSTFGQNTSSVVDKNFGAGTACSWSPTIDASNNAWSVELVVAGTVNGTYTVAPDSRTAFTACYIGPVT